MKCRIISIWHEGPYMLNRDRLISAEFISVPYMNGIGRYTIMGYLANTTEDDIAIILDNSFTILEGNPPEETDCLLTDNVKTCIGKLVSKMMVITRIHSDNITEYLIDDVKMSENAPDQIKEINKWVYTKLAIDHNFTISNDEYNPNLYFPNQIETDELTVMISQFEQFITLSKAAAQQLSHKLRFLSFPIKLGYLEEMKSSLADLSIDTHVLDALLDNHINDLKEEQSNGENQNEGNRLNAPIG